MRAIAILAAAATIAGTGEAGSAVIVTALPEPVFMEGGLLTRFRFPIDIDGDEVEDFTFATNAFGTYLRTERANRVVYFVDPPPNLGGPVAPLPEGFQIGSIIGDPRLDWRSADLSDMFVEPGENSFIGISVCAGNCAPLYNGIRASIGIEFELDDGIHYGYFDLAVPLDAPSALLYGWAWETQPGVPIEARMIPEPSTPMLFLVASLGLGLRRQRKPHGSNRVAGRF